MFNKNKSKTNEPLFFLFTCVKDGRKYINKLFDSLLAQTKINFVHYIYEDGSKDPLDEMVEQYKEKVSKLSNPYEIIYEKNPINIGLNMATKHCIDKCFCPYFIWIDCDNWVDKDFFKHLGKQVKKNPNSILYRSTCYNGSSSAIRKRVRDISIYHPKRSQYVFLFPCFCNYHFSFFAVNFKEYMSISNNQITNDRYLYNDIQVLTHCYSSDKPVCVSKKSVGYVLVRDDSEYWSTATNDIDIKKRRNDFKMMVFNNSKKASWFDNYYTLIKKMHIFYKEYNSCNYKGAIKDLRNAFMYAREKKSNVFFVETRINVFKYYMRCLIGILKSKH